MQVRTAAIIQVSSVLSFHDQSRFESKPLIFPSSFFFIIPNIFIPLSIPPLRPVMVVDASVSYIESSHICLLLYYSSIVRGRVDTNVDSHSAVSLSERG